MSRLQELLNKEGSLDKLSFYPDYLLDFRSILSEWVEAQDWAGLVCLSGEALTSGCKELWEEAVSLLLQKRQNPGFEFHVHSTVAKLKKAYQTDSVKFAQDLHRCLIEEEDLLKNMMAQEQAMLHDREGPVQELKTMKEMSDCIGKCHSLEKRVYQVLKAAYLCIDNWPEDIRNKSNIPRDVFRNGETFLPPYHVLQGLKQELDNKSRMVIQELNTVLSALQYFIVQWKNWQLHQCVSRKVEGESKELIDQVEDMCEHVCSCVCALMTHMTSKHFQMVNTAFEQSQLPAPSPSIPTPSTFSSLCLALKSILGKILEMFLVVKKQPPLTMMIEKEKGQREKDDINNSKKFTTTVGILGGKGFKDGLLIKEVEIYLAFCQDLYKAQRNNRRPDNAFRIYHDQPDARGRYSSRYSSGSPDSPSLPYERTYEKLRVEQFSRKETKHVYKQLYHVVYDVKVHIPAFMQDFTTQAISLPIIVRTGANQASEHIGAQLWHSYSSPNVYNLQGEMAASMKVDEVVQMINERIGFIGGEGLTAHQKDFLKERLYMVAAGKGDARYSGDTTITLDNFIKDKVYLPRHDCTTPAKDMMDFSLWRWLHSIINLLDEPENLRNPWIDGIIYGFASRQQCKNALEGSQDGTFLLRFSESALQGNHKMAKGGLAAVIHRNGQVDFAPPISADDIEKEGLGIMIASTGSQYLYGTNLTINDLCVKYPASKPLENPTSNRYQGWRKYECFLPNNQVLNGSAQMGSPNPYPSGTPTQRVHKKPKRSSRRLQDSPSNKHYRAASPASPESLSSISVPSPQTDDSHPHFQMVGFQEMHPQTPAAWSDSSTNIPLTVYMSEEINPINSMFNPCPVVVLDQSVTSSLENMDLSESDLMLVSTDPNLQMLEDAEEFVRMEGLPCNGNKCF